jgi:tRNA threonylcarbamoyladenosine biosynthesis protein TsaB
VLILAFDTATPQASVALVRDGDVLGERPSQAVRVLADADELLLAAGFQIADLEALAVGTGPGSFTGVRIGLAAVRGLALAVDIPAAGVSTLDALAAAAPQALPMIDARRKEVFVLLPEGPAVLAPADISVAPGTVCVGDGAVRYRSVLEDLGATIPPDRSDVHRPRASFHASLATQFGPADEIEPLYLRVPDADRARAA